MKWYMQCWSKYGVFSGRARRKEYWMFVLFNAIMSVILQIIDGALMTGGVLCGIYYLVAFIPSTAVLARRLHDIDKSGWFMLVCLIPLIGWIWLLVLVCTEGTRGDNRFGADPKALAE